MASPGQAPKGRATRVLFLILAVFVAAGAVSTVKQWQSATPDDDGDESVTLTPLPEGDASLADLLGRGTSVGTPPGPGDDAAPPIDAAAELDHWKGTAVLPGTRVEVDVLPEVGLESSYEIRRTAISTHRETGGVIASRLSEGVTTKVVSSTKDGGRRVELRRTWFKLQSLLGPVLAGEYDSRTPDERLRDDPRFATWIATLTELLEVPYEITLDAHGAAVSISGVDEARRRVGEVYGRKGVALQADIGPHDQLELEAYRNALFPPVGGGALVAGEPRPFRYREDTQAYHWATFDGRLDVTHEEGDAFCVTLGSSTSGCERSLEGRILPTGQTLLAVRVPPEKDQIEASWVFDRAKGRLLSARVHPRFNLWISVQGVDDAGGPKPEPSFYVVEQLLAVDLVK